jgi:hypothetical protein
LSRAQHPCHRRGLFEGSTHERGRTARNVVRAHPSRRNDRANARSAIGKRDQPKPAKSAAFAKHDNLDVPFPLARIAPCPPDLRVKRGPIEARDPIHGGARPGDDGFASGRIDYESPQKGVNAAVGREGPPKRLETARPKRSDRVHMESISGDSGSGMAHPIESLEYELCWPDDELCRPDDGLCCDK